MYKSVYGANAQNEWIALAYVHMSSCYEKIGRSKEAKIYHDKAILMHKRIQKAPQAAARKAFTKWKKTAAKI